MINFTGMKQQLLFLPRLLVIWLILFTLQRLLFVFHFFSEFEGHYGELFLVPFYALRLDISGFSYIIGLAFLLSIFAFFIQTERGIKILNRIISIYIWILFVAAALIAAGEIVSYYEWHTKLSSKIWIHFSTPSEIFRTSSGSYTYWFLLYMFIQLVISWLVYSKWFKKNKLTVMPSSLKTRSFGAAGYLVIGTLLLGLGVRGGWQKIPVSATNGNCSKKLIVNDVCVNSVWNFISMTYAHLKVDIASYFRNLPPEEAESLKNNLYFTPGDSITHVLTSNRPNIILITLEGWSGQLIEPLGGEKDITPQFNSLCKEGVLFTEIYATGGTSETGHSSIISGYPTISGISISKESAKCRQLPSINQELEKIGYSTFYTFGGALSYGNIGGYLNDVGFDRLVDENDLDLEPKGELGIHDEAMFPYFFSEVEKAKRPYFYGMFTQSTHSPYDMPASPYPGYDGDLYVTSMHYADEHLGKFAEQVRTLPDFDNTLVIFISDHGKTNLINSDTYQQDFFHIPMLFWGGAVKSEMRGKQIDKIGSQADLAATLLHQLELDLGAFHWSKNLLNPSSPEWAICTSTLSYGWKDSAGYTVYQMIGDYLIYSAYENETQTNQALKNCRAVLECMYREYEKM